jgi:ligand-binding sensor domain-containing protein
MIERFWRLARSRRMLYLCGGVMLALALYTGWAGWRALRALRDASEAVASESRIRFAERRLDRPAPAGFDILSAPAAYRDAAVFNGKLYLAGAAGLFAFRDDGASGEQYLVGRELPPAPLTRLAVAAVGGAPELWIGTEGEGLLAFDGRGFRQIRATDPEMRKVTALMGLGTGRLLIGTARRGLIVWEGQRLAPFHASLAGVPVTALAGSESELWIGTQDRGLLWFRAGEMRAFRDELPDVHVLDVAVRGGAAFAATAMGVAEIREGRLQRVLGPGLFARALAPRETALVAGTLADGAVEIPLSVRPSRGVRPPRISGPASVERLVEISGKLLMLSGDGLYDGEKNLTPPGPARLADRNLSALAVDGEGRIWVGYFDHGLQILDPAGGSKRIDDEHVFCVNRIALDEARGGAAVATANGLALIEASGAVRRVLGREQGLIANHVTDVVLRPGGMVAATPAGLTIFDGGGARSLYAFHGLVTNHVYALAASGARLLAGTLGGLSVLDRGAVSASFTPANSALAHNWISAIVRVGEEWFIGAYGGGVLRLDDAGRWSRFPDMPRGVEVNPGAMLATDRAVYAGTLGGGLMIYDRAGGRWRSRSDGLPSANVTALAARGGFVYVGTDNGLVRAPEEVLVSR